ncbi:MAG TPA: hypothetical protein VHC22_34615 [Pirellulales bacterium]|nr:hypothetical protein [Pirellulales bacterium]
MNALYQVLLVEESERRPGTASLHPAPFTSYDPSAAKMFADAFNERELTDPVGLWAIVRVDRSNRRRTTLRPDLLLAQFGPTNTSAAQ